MTDLSRAPHFGVFHLSLPAAGLLIAKCLWFRGEIDANIAARDSYHFHDQALAKALRRPAAKYRELLVQAVADNRLPAARLQRDLAGDIIAAKTFVEALTLADWLEDHGIVLGEVFDQEYVDVETLLAHRIADLVAAERHRHAQRAPAVPAVELLPEQAELVFLRHRVAALEAELSAAGTADAAHAPITEKQRGAYLNIIGALIGLLLGQSAGGKPYSVFTSQAAIIDAIHGTFGEAPGLSQRNLVDKFAAGKRALRATKK